MTVVLAVRCADGLVLGADSQITEDDRGMTYPARKLHPLGDRGAWGGSGSRAVLLDLEERLRDAAKEILAAPNVARALQSHVLPELRYHYEHYIDDVPGGVGLGPPAAYVLAAGYAGDEPFIIEVNPNGMAIRQEEIGYHAIGSGAPMAQQAGSLLAHFRVTERSVRHGVLVMVRVLDALTMTAPKVGGPVDVIRITPDGAESLDEEQIEAVRKDVQRWKEREDEVLDTLFD